MLKVHSDSYTVCYVLFASPRMYDKKICRKLQAFSASGKCLKAGHKKPNQRVELTSKCAAAVPKGI